MRGESFLFDIPCAPAIIVAMQIPALSRQMIIQALGGLTPVMLVSLKSDLSRTVNSGVAGTRALAASWQAEGAQRLCDLHSKVPRVSIKLGKVIRLPNFRLNA